MRQYIIGNEIILTASFSDVATKTPANPTTVGCRVLGPDHTETALTPVNVTVGEWQASYTPTTSGVWRYRWEGTGSVIAAAEGAFEVRPSAFTSPL